MVQLLGLAVSVLVDGKELVEYPDEEADDLRLNATNHYIESQVGKEFAFKLTWDASIFDGCVGIACKIFVDGVQVEQPVMFPQDRGTRMCTGPKHYSNGIWTEQPLVFADIQISEDSTSVTTSKDSNKRVNKLGLISVLVQRASTKTMSQNQLSRESAALKSHAVSEKALKGQAIDTKAMYGTSRASSSTQFWDCTYIEPLSDPFITFNWKYRSRKALQIMTITPRSPTPEPLEDRPLETLSREELVELVRRRGADISVPIKSESKDVGLGPSKRERDAEVDEILASARPAKKQLRIEEVEVIDLLDD